MHHRLSPAHMTYLHHTRQRGTDGFRYFLKKRTGDLRTEGTRIHTDVLQNAFRIKVADADGGNVLMQHLQGYLSPSAFPSLCALCSL